MGDPGGPVAETTPRVWVATILGTAYTLYRADELYGTILAGSACVWKRHVDETIGCGTAKLIWLQLTDLAGSNVIRLELHVDDAFGNALHCYRTESTPSCTGINCAATYTLNKSAPFACAGGAGSCGGTDNATVNGDDAAYIKECCACGSAGSGSDLPSHGCDNGCCEGDTAREAYDVDLGAGGWIDTSACNGCNEVKGVYTLQQSGAAGACVWQYKVARYCSMLCTPGGTIWFDLVITLSRLLVTPLCFWRVDVQLTADISSEANCPRGVAIARYDSSPEAKTVSCAAASPISIPRISNSSGPCDGTLPASITIQGV